MTSGTPVARECLSYPDWTPTTPLQPWPPFIWTDPSYQVCQFWLLHRDPCNQPLLSTSSSAQRPLLTIHMSKFLVSFSCTNLKPHAVGNHADSIHTDSAMSRFECQGQEIRPCKRVINTAESSSLVKGHSIQRAFQPVSEQRCSHTQRLPKRLSWLLPLVLVRFHIQPAAFDHASLHHTHITIPN